jgi:hypothetical protein
VLAEGYSRRQARETVSENVNELLSDWCQAPVLID